MADRREIEEIEKDLLRRPYERALREEYAEALGEAGRFSSALEQYRILMGEAKDAASFRAAAVCLLMLGRDEEAAEIYAEARWMNGFNPHEELEALSARLKAADNEDDGDGEDEDEPEERLPVAPREAVSFDDIVGMDELKKILRIQIIEPFLKPGIFAKFKKKAGGGVLLYGPPGCGKTMIARAIAHECRAYFISVGISDVLNRWHGESERNLSYIFDRARSNRPAVLFFDELDALAYSRSKASSEHTRTVVNEFLTQLDGLDSTNEQVMVLAATNMPWDVDPAMKRPGRFARQIFVAPPDDGARAEMFRLKLDGVPTEDVDYKACAKALPFASGADIDGLIDMAKEAVLIDIMDSQEERGIRTEDLVRVAEDFEPSTLEWLRTAKNLVMYAGIDKSYRDVEKYLKRTKLI